jgi:hypothetical protein
MTFFDFCSQPITFFDFGHSLLRLTRLAMSSSSSTRCCFGLQSTWGCAHANMMDSKEAREEALQYTGGQACFDGACNRRMHHPCFDHYYGQHSGYVEGKLWCPSHAPPDSRWRQRDNIDPVAFVSDEIIAERKFAGVVRKAQGDHAALNRRGIARGHVPYPYTGPGAVAILLGGGGFWTMSPATISGAEIWFLRNPN